MASDGRDFHLRWKRSQPPLRLHPDVPVAVARHLEPGDDPVLLLGVTPELADIAAHVVAMDWNEAMIASVWPGDTSARRAMLGDWRSMALPDKSMAAAVGDGCFTMLSYPEDARLLIEQLARVLRPGARAVIRCFATPEEGEDVLAVRDASYAGGIGFHAFKLRFNQAVTLESGRMSITSDDLFRRFQALFPDREALSRASGWSLETIAEMDAYRGAASIHSYPSRSRLLELVPDGMRDAFFAPSGDYPLAERCPLFILDFP
jgi:SAM-dependent methyltransferase